MPPDSAAPAPGITEPDFSAIEPNAVVAPSERLRDVADWGYLLQEVRTLYATMPSGGSDPIRRHVREVIEHLNRAVRANPPLATRVRQDKPVTRHFGRALDNGEAGMLASAIRALTKVRKELFWQYGYDRMPKSLEQKYAYAEILGPRGPVIYDSLIIGLVLFAPKTVYPQHAHTGITESYICLSGAVSENHMGVYRPGSLILNQPGAEHRITSQNYEPALLVYAWAGAPSDLSGQEMTLSRKRRSQKTP